MQIKLTHVNPIDQSSAFQLYSATADMPLMPGQWLEYNNQIISCLSCREQADGFRYLLQTNIAEAFADSLLAELKGDEFLNTPPQAVTILAESHGVAMALHWLDYQRQQLGEQAVRKLCRLMILHAREEFSFTPIPSTFVIGDLPGDMIAAVPLLEDLGIASRLCCDVFKPGCYEGSLIDLCNAMGSDINDLAWIGFVNPATAQHLNSRLGQASALKQI